MNRGLLLTLTEPPGGMDEEFNAWYDQEHLAERRAIPGFRSAQRWVIDCKPGEGRYLATYELDSPGVLSSPAYLARYRNQTPWSRRCLGKAVVFKRWACEQVSPGAADAHPAAKAIALAFGRPDIQLQGSVLQVRRFAAFEGEPKDLTLVELGDANAAAAPAASPLANALVYRRYEP